MGTVKIEELEGEVIPTSDYFFEKIGDPVPLKPSDSNFDLETLPSHALALSQRFRLTFVAHSSGFFVARTKDLIDSAKEFKDKGSGSPVQQLSLADVSIGRVRILALSTDNSTLAAAVDGDIRFYSVGSFLNKEVKQSFSCSLNNSTFVKDMRWITTSEHSYVVLSNTGALYHGESGFPLKLVMESVEAVDWGVKGTFVAVARKNVLSILSTKFEEKVSISLPFESWIGDSADNVSIKVDSIKCVRPDSIIIGCFQLTEDGKEENYLIQVIRSKLGEIADGCSELVVQSFYEIYPCLIDDIVPFGTGPYLLLTYLEQCQLAINGNMKSTDDHIVLLGWSIDGDKSEAAVGYVKEDKYMPRIGLQENGDDNLVLGLCIDNVSIYEKVKIQLGGEERTELSPYCVLLCLTLEGKLVMFHVASLAGSKVSPEFDSTVHDEDDALVMPPVDKSSTSSPGLQKKTQEDKAVEVIENLKSKPHANPYQITQTEDSKHREVEPVTNIQSQNSYVQQMVPNVDVNQDTDNQNPSPPGEQQKNVGQKTAALGTSTGSFIAGRHSAPHGFSSYNLQETTEMTTGLWNKNSSQGSERVSRPLHGETFSFQKNTSLSSFSASSYADGVGYQSEKDPVGATNIPDSTGRKPFIVRDVSGVSPAINSASRSVQSGGQTTVNIQPVVGGSSPVTSNGNTTTGKSFVTTSGKSSVQKFLPSNEQRGTSFKLPMSSSDFSKQFGNISEMTKELDLLLKSIEEAGGFRDACTRSLHSSVEAVEQSMDTISKQCKIWTCQVDQHLEQVHYLLNKTIQVVARKIYMESIYKQASDSRYWDLWNRQKLNSELELKRQHILSLNQDLTYQLIELERHFNALELNKFSQSGGHRKSLGAFQNRHGPSRSIQSLHSLHNAIGSQLVAAENLSECLSKQVAALSLRSVSEDQKNVKELFETIGIPYDASFGSPDIKGFMKTPPSKKLLFPDLTINKSQSIRNQASTVKSCEPETSRRRRDSLDQSLTCFEPPKTIIKRMLLQDLQKPKWNESFISMKKEKVKISMLEESALHQVGARIPSSVFPDSKMKASIRDSHLRFEEVSEHSKVQPKADNLQAPIQVSDSESRVLQRTNSSAVASRPAFQLSAAMMHGHRTETKDLAAEKSNVFQNFDLISRSESKSILNTKLPQKSSISANTTTATPVSMFESSELMPISNSKMTLASSSIMGDKLSGAFNPESQKKYFPSSGSQSSTISAASTLLGKVNGFDADKNRPNERSPAVPSFSGSRESLSSTIKSPSASPVSSAAVLPAAVSVTSSKTSKDSNHIISTSSASDFLYLSNQDPKPTSSALSSPPCSNSTSESVKSEIQPAGVSNLKTEDAASEAVSRLNEPLNSESELKLGSSRKFTPTNEQPSNNVTSSELKVVSVSKSELPSDAPLQLSTSFLASASVSSGKNGGLDFGISHEDEMEEEAPETSNTTELSLGSLGGFGLGSSPNQSVPKPNPFGGSFNNVSSSAITFSVPSGELFRPASFSFPSPQSSTPAQSTNSGAFAGGFGTGVAVPTQAPSAFGQPAQIGSGQQVLGSVLGTFGQSRQLGSGLPGSGSAAPCGFGGGFAGGSPTGGFSNAATAGGFAGIASTGGGFAGISSTGGGGFTGVAATGGGFSGFASPVGGGFGGAASTGGGFGGAAPTGGGFGGAAPTGGGFGGAASTGGGFGGTGGGFGGAASTGGGFGAVPSAGGFAGAGSGGGGFGAFSNQGSGGFGAFGKDGGSKPPELFTQMRK